MEQFLPNLNESVRKIILGIRKFKSVPTDTQVYAHMLFNSPEDKLFVEKYKQLTKYIAPLKRMIGSMSHHDVEKLTKLNALLEILCNPSRRVPLETLTQYEPILDKIVNFYNGVKILNPLLDALNITLRSPIANHTLCKTFSPSLKLFVGTDISAPMTTRQTRLCYEEPLQILTHILHGEIAYLDQKFKVSQDTSAQNKNTIKLICYLDDNRLPSVPPICVNIPEKYPFSSPICTLTAQEYSITPFLLDVQNVLISRTAKLPSCYSLTRLLDTWEMSVRQVCSPNNTAINDLTAIFGM